MPDTYEKMYDPDEVPLRKNVFKDGMMAHDEMWFKTYTIWDYPLLVWPQLRSPEGASRTCVEEERLSDRETDKLPEGLDARCDRSLLWRNHLRQ